MVFNYKGIAVIDIIKDACLMLNLEDVSSCIEHEEFVADGDKVTTTIDNVDTIATLNQLLRCVNLVVSEVACDYAPLITIEDIEAEDQNLYFDKFRRSLIDIVNVRKGGDKVKFRILPLSIAVTGSGTYSVEYSYLPTIKNIYGKLDYALGKLSPRILAYGVAMEYSVICGNFDDATLWESRFHSSVGKPNARVERKVKARMFV